MGKLTAKQVETAIAKEKEYKLSDGLGLYLRVRTTGAKSWLYCFRLPGNRRMIPFTIGSLEDVSLKDARDRLKELRKQVAQGLDPRNERAAVIAENVGAITMYTLFEAWISFERAGSNMRPLCAERHEERWRLHLAKPLGNILVRELTRAHLAAALEKMTRKGIREGTRKTLTTLNLMLDYGLTRHFVDQNFARVLKPKDFAATAGRPRDRVLSLIELRQLWIAVDYAMTARAQIAQTALLTPMTAIAIKLLILTGARRSEVAGMSWSELNLGVGTWLLPWNRTKNGRPHIIYLSNLSISLLKELQALTGQSFFVFDTGRASGIGHINPDSLNRALTRLKKRESGNLALSSIEPFTIHDLRRSAATAWGEHLKILPHIIEHMLNHQPANKLMATYQRAVYAEEQKAAWLAWGSMIEHQVAKVR